MSKLLIIYHKEDNDGVMSAAIAKAYAVSHSGYDEDDITYLPMDYNTARNLDKGFLEELCNMSDNIIMTDFSLSADMMKMIKKLKGNHFIWIDHHAPALKTSHENGYSDIPGERDTNMSAILLAYRFFYDPLMIEYNNGNCPELLRILSAWDSFSYKREGYDLEYVKKINSAFTAKYNLSLENVYKWVVEGMMYEFDCNEFNTIEQKEEIVMLENDGNFIDRYERSKNSRLVDEYGDNSWTVDGKPATALFKQGASSSMMFRDSVNPHGIVFKRNKDGSWTVSVYNRDVDNTFHCGEYLKKKYNGGGHTGAAGCIISENTFVKLLKSHEL